MLEQNGPWGRHALTESHLDPDVGAELERRTEGTGVRIGLIRRPGRHSDQHVPKPRQVYLAHTAPERSWLEHAVIDEAKDLLDLDFTTVAAGHRPGLGTLAFDPLLFVCTNARRDRCCAVLGRGVALSLAAVHGETVWETSHLGGHRFAPTAVLLPTGYVYGQLDATAGHHLLAAAGKDEMVLDHCRGRSTWTRPGQAADLAVRRLTGETRPDAFSVVTSTPAGTGRWNVEVTGMYGRFWRVTVEEGTEETPRPESCGGPAVRPSRIEVLAVDRLT